MVPADLISILQSRMEWLVPLIGAGFFIGEYISRYSGMEALFAHGAQVLANLQRKLDKRSTATRAYRGIIALFIALLPALAASIALTQKNPLAAILAPLLMIALFGHALRIPSLYIIWRQAKLGKLSLELPRSDFLFVDTHGALRYAIARSAEHYATGFVGAAFWYVLLGLPTMLAYVSITACARTFREGIFGWAARGLFRLLDALPRMLTALLFVLAALFIPHTHPFKALRAKSWHGFAAELIGTALGGPMPEGILAWAGTGTPKTDAGHLGRWLLLLLVATILLVFLMSTSAIINLLNHMI